MAAVRLTVVAMPEIGMLGLEQEELSCGCSARAPMRHDSDLSSRCKETRNNDYGMHRTAQLHVHPPSCNMDPKRTGWPIFVLTVFDSSSLDLLLYVVGFIGGDFAGDIL